MENNKLEQVNDNKYMLEVKNIKEYFPIETDFFGKPTRFLRAVDEVSFSIEKGKTIGVVGESGCGKTTLGRTILKLYEATGGNIIFNGIDITKFTKKQMVNLNYDKYLLKQNLDNEINEIEQTYSEKIKSLNKEASNYLEEVSNVKKEKNKKIADARKRYNASLKNINVEIAESVKKLKEEFNKAKQDLIKKGNKEQYEEELNNLRSEYRVNLRKLTKNTNLRTEMQLIFQDPYSSLPPRMTVGNIITEAVKVHHIVPDNEIKDYVRDIMKKCGLQPQYFDRYPHEFSGGQRQRICIARALAVKPKLVICDEPVSALDVSIQAQIINLLKELQLKMGLTYVFISHDLSVVKYITDKILVMYLGNMMEQGDTDDIFDNPLHPYTKALFSAVPVPDPDYKMNRIILGGDIPSPANPPKGCKFHTRCSECMNVCKFKNPEYIEARPNHFVACHLYNKDIMDHIKDYDKEYEKIVAEAKKKEQMKNKKQRLNRKQK